MHDRTDQQQLEADWLTCEIRAVAREARRIASEGATDDERTVHEARKRAVLAEINGRREPVQPSPSSPERSSSAAGRGGSDHGARSVPDCPPAVNLSLRHFPHATAAALPPIVQRVPFDFTSSGGARGVELRPTDDHLPALYVCDDGTVEIGDGARVELGAFHSWLDAVRAELP